MNQARNISIITNQLTINEVIEIGFIQNVILQQIPFGLEWDLNSYHDGVVIYLELGCLSAEVIEQLKAQGNKVVICQLGDEFKEKYSFELYKSCDLILRNYFFSEIFTDPEVGCKTIWIPNGPKAGVGGRRTESLRPANYRHFLSSFLGWLDNPRSFGNERELFRQAALQAPQDILLQPTEYFAKGFNIGMYSAILEYSIFCPCPAGNSPETIRLYDALEMGCIPISLKHDFLQSPLALGRPPFPLLDSWDQLPSLLADYRAKLASDPDSVVRQQQRCLDWWSIYKKSISVTISQKLYELSER
jgi:hypothetical protein